MQHATTIQTSRWHRGATVIRMAALLVVLIAALAALWATRPQGAPATPVIPARPTQALPLTSMRFADEAAYVPTLQEYKSSALGEDYLPIAPAVPADSGPSLTAGLSSRILRDELAGAMIMALSASIATETTEASLPLAGPR